MINLLVTLLIISGLFTLQGGCTVSVGNPFADQGSGEEGSQKVFAETEYKGLKLVCSKAALGIDQKVRSRCYFHAQNGAIFHPNDRAKNVLDVEVRVPRKFDVVATTGFEQFGKWSVSIIYTGPHLDEALAAAVVADVRSTYVGIAGSNQALEVLMSGEEVSEMNQEVLPNSSASNPESSEDTGAKIPSPPDDLALCEGGEKSVALDGYCYSALTTEKMRQAEAKDMCGSWGADLPVVYRAQDMDFFKAEFAPVGLTSIWLAATRDSDNTFVYDYSDSDFFAFMSYSQPEQWEGNDKCLKLKFATNIGMVAIPCTSFKRQVVCVRPIP